MPDWNRSVELTQQLCRYNTYDPEGKLPALEMIATILRGETDAEVTIHEAKTGPYLVAVLRTPTPCFRLLLDGHVDVVSPEGVDRPFEAEIRDGIIYGRGTADMKSGCAAILTAFLAAAAVPGRKGEVYLMYSTDEEYAGEQIIEALENHVVPRCDFAMIAEPTGLELCNAHKGELWIDVDFYGKSAHSSTPELGKNALYMAAQFTLKMKDYVEKEYPAQRHELYGVPTLNIGVLTGGSTPNLVPHHAQAKIDQRYLPGHTREETMQGIDTVLEACRSENPDFQAKATVVGEWDACIVERDSPKFKKALDAITKATGHPVPLGLMFGWGEGGYIQRYEIPTVYYGPGESRFAHTPDEQCPINQIVEASAAYYEIIRSFCYES